MKNPPIRDVRTSAPLGSFAAARQVLTISLFGVLPLVATFAILTAAFIKGPFLYDFRGGLYGAGRDIVHGKNPYRAGQLAEQARIQRSGGTPKTVVSVPVYPAPALVAVVPFALLPYKVAGVLFVLLSISALALALWILGVTDWRCYGVAFGCWPVLHGLMLGALSPLLVLGTALLWRHRQSTLVPAAALAAIVAAKLFLWPLGAWLLITRRLRVAALAAVLIVLGTVAAWAAIGFAGFADYPTMLGNLALISEGVSVSFVAALLHLGLGASTAKAAALVVGLAALAAAWRLSRGSDGDRRAFDLALIASLVASPIVWPHYTALLLVPVALASPTLSTMWLVPLLSYLAPVAQTGVHPWAIVPYLAMSVVLAYIALRGRRFESAALEAPPYAPGIATRP
jgi:Glycosyltransferase family 87